MREMVEGTMLQSMKERTRRRRTLKTLLFFYRCFHPSYQLPLSSGLQEEEEKADSDEGETDLDTDDDGNDVNEDGEYKANLAKISVAERIQVG